MKWPMGKQGIPMLKNHTLTSEQVMIYYQQIVTPTANEGEESKPMRCPYCGNLNADTLSYCKRCGRDITSPPNPATARQQPSPQQPPYQQPQRSMYPPSPSPRQVTPVQAPPYQQRQSVPPPSYTVPEPRGQQRPHSPLVPPAPVVPAAPEAPAPFPPRTVAHLQALEQGALTYTLISDDVSNGRKRIVRIAYARCVGWQQMATLCKALKEYQISKCETIVIQGVADQHASIYGFTNGQLIFDRNVRLGSQVIQRYQIETDNGFASDSIRVVISE